jgi:type II restriction enzyme
MKLTCDLEVTSSYRGSTQRARVISEHWFAQNCYCLACDSNRLTRSAPNTRATDFSCEKCGHRYELKAFLKRPTKSLVNGAYSALISRINSNSAPTLCLLGRDVSWQVNSLVAIHSCFLTPWVIERRPPLSQHARRAGWVGCNIRLDGIPTDGEIAVIDGGICRRKLDVRSQFRRFLPLEHLSAEQRGWTTLTLAVVRALGRRRFLLSDLYDREKQFASVYPANRHIRAKIRQQLQVLRDLGILNFEGRGAYTVVG